MPPWYGLSSFLISMSLLSFVANKYHIWPCACKIDFVFLVPEKTFALQGVLESKARYRLYQANCFSYKTGRPAHGMVPEWGASKELKW